MWMCHAGAHLNRVSGIHLLRDMPTVWENLGFPRYIQPFKILWHSFFQDMFIAPWPQGTAALRSSHQLRLLPCLQKPGILVLFTADIVGPKVVAFWELWKWNYFVAYTGLVVLVCKPCTSVLEEFSWKNNFSLLSYAYYFIFFSIGKQLLCFYRSWAPSCPLPHCWREAERAFLPPVKNCNKFHHLVVEPLGKG